jgi:DNA-binding transcriptional regulator/RsmH inhibitor MraZ
MQAQTKVSVPHISDLSVHTDLEPDVVVAGGHKSFASFWQSSSWDKSFLQQRSALGTSEETSVRPAWLFLRHNLIADLET